MNENIISFCGDYPPDYKPITLPLVDGFVFDNDPDFEPVLLFDYDKNVVTVNSFVECEHYVNGGWDYIPNDKLPEPFFHNALMVFSLVGVAVIYFLFNSKFKFLK